MSISVTPAKTKKEMKDVFGKADALYYDPTILDFSKATTLEAAVTLTPQYDFPVLLDSIQVSTGDPNLSHVKIIGLAGDWYMDAEQGDSKIEFTVPTKDTNVLTVAFGEDAVKTYFVKVGSATLTGTGLTLKTNKVTGTWAMLNKEHDQIMIINGSQLFATPMYGGNDNVVVSVKFTGALTCNGVDPDLLWLKEQ